MNATEIKDAGSTFLNQRLAVVTYSTIEDQRIEAAAIRAELERRGHVALLGRRRA